MQAHVRAPREALTDHFLFRSTPLIKPNILVIQTCVQGMKLPRSARGSSAPPLSLTSASIRLTYATTTPAILRPRRRTRGQPTQERLEVRERLGSPFAFNPVPRATSPSVSESLSVVNGGGFNASQPLANKSAYWLRSSAEPEWAFLLSRVTTPTELRLVIERARGTGDNTLLARCQDLLIESLLTYAVGPETWESLHGMELLRVMQYADMFGYWGLDMIPGREGVRGEGRRGTGYNGIVDSEVVLTEKETADRYTTPPAQILHSLYR